MGAGQRVVPGRRITELRQCRLVVDAVAADEHDFLKAAVPDKMNDRMYGATVGVEFFCSRNCGPTVGKQLLSFDGSPAVKDQRSLFQKR